MNKRALLFLICLITPLSAFAADGASFAEQGQFGNSEIKYYSGDLGLFVTLPAYATFGEPTALTLIYRSQAANPFVTLLTEKKYIEPFHHALVQMRFGDQLIERSFKGLQEIDPKALGYVFRGHFPAADRASGFYPGVIESTLYRSGGICSACADLPLVGKYFEGYQKVNDSVQKPVFVLNSQRSDYGAGWFLSMDQRLYVSRDRKNAVIVNGSGTLSYFEGLGDELLKGVGQNKSTLSLIEGRWHLTALNGNRELYDSRGFLLQKTDRQGRTYDYSREDTGRLYRITDPLKRTIQLGYNPKGMLEKIIDPTGRQTRFGYDHSGNLNHVLFPDNSQLTYQYDDRHLVTQKTTPRGYSTRYTYDDFGKVVQTQDAVGAIKKFKFGYEDGSLNLMNRGTLNPLVEIGSVKSVFTDALGASRTYYFKRIPFIWKTVDALGRVTTQEHDRDGNLVEETWANGNKVTYTYDSNGNRTESYNHGSDAKTRMAYNSSGQLTELTDAEDANSRFNYDALGNLTSFTNPENEKTEFTYNAQSQLISQTAVNGAVTRFEYDPQGNLIKTTDALKNETLYAYDPSGNLIRQVSPSGVTTQYAYDSMNRMLEMVLPSPDGKGAKTTYNYAEAKCDCNTANLATSVTDALGNSVIREYDAIGQLTQVTDALGNKTQYSYTPTRKLAKVTDALGRVRSFDYDDEGQLLQVNEPNDTHVRFDYDALSNLSKLTNANDHSTLFKYDLSGRMIQETDAEGRPTQYSYNNADRVIQTLYPDQTKVSYLYDRAGKLTKRFGEPTSIGDGGNLLEQTIFEYTQGNLTRAINEDAVVERKYDSLNRLIEEITQITQGPTHIIRYKYEKQNLAESVFADQKTNYAYDATGYLKMIANGDDRVIFEYDSLGRRQKISVNNKFVKKYVYDANNRLTALNYKWDNKPVFAEAISYNAVSNIIQKKENEEFFEYEYDGIDQLLKTKNNQNPEQFYYDLAGNHLFDFLKPAIYSKTNALIVKPLNKIAYKHDEIGRLVSLNEDKRQISLIWNDRLQLKESYVNQDKVSYLYDPFGRRIAKIAKNVSKEFYGYQGGDIVAIYNNSSRVESVELPGSWIDEHLIAKNNDNTNFYISDYLGSIKAILNKNGDKIAEYQYSSFGRKKIKLEIEKEIVSKIYSYSGREWDAETGWYYYRNRYYSADEQRFISPDPIGFYGGMNLYAYVSGNPILNIDPLGLDTYRINRDLSKFGDSSRSIYNPITHTFIVTTNADGSIKHTYSWGNDANLRGWNLDQALDVKTAQEALGNKDAKFISDSGLDPYVHEAFNKINTAENEHVNFVVFNNCKAEATNLIDEAKKLRDEALKKVDAKNNPQYPQIR